MSTRENIRLIARSPFATFTFAVKDMFNLQSKCKPSKKDFLTSFSYCY